jgi:hypothetical protein
MADKSGTQIIQGWPMDSQEATQLVIDKYGEPHEATESELIWHKVGPWKRIVASKVAWQHNFPMPHQDCVETFIDYRVPVDKYSDIVRFDGSVTIERTSGEVSARCHDEEANTLALNLMHDIVTGARTVEQAREYYGKEVLDYRRKKPTPYMQTLRFAPAPGNAADPDTRILSDEDLKRAAAEAKASS